jgi:hypothetical protein
MSAETYAVVFQMGKVASTSLVQTLNAVENVTAVQSHFLGDRSLKEMISLVTDASLPDYFFEHQLGQLVSNIGITRHINLFRSDPSRGNLLIMSIARDPLDWLRSSIVQDIEGYLPYLRRVAGEQSQGGLTDDEAVIFSLKHILRSVAEIANANDGLDQCILNLNSPKRDPFIASTILADTDFYLMFDAILRPFDWFKRHFERSLGIKISDMTDDEGIFHNQIDNVDYIILR